MDSIAEQLVSRLRRDPNDFQAYEALKEHYRETGDVPSLVNLLEGWAEYQTHAVLSSEAYLEAARAWHAADGDQERTKALYGHAVRLDPENRDAALELIGVLQEAGDHHALAELLDNYLRAVEAYEMPPTFLAELYTQLGDLWNNVFERPDVARPCYERALELDPTFTGAAYAARKLVQETGDAEATAHLYALEAASETDPERKIQLYAKLAELHATERDDLDGAIIALRSALAAAPGDIQIMHQLASYLSSRATRHAGDQSGDSGRDRRRAAELYYQIAQGVEAEEALAYLEAALAAAPAHDGALAMLEQLAPRLGSEDVLPGYWVAYLAQATQGPEVDQRRMALAQAYERAGQIEDAIFCLEQTQVDGQMAQYLAELVARRGMRASTPPEPRAERLSSAPSDGAATWSPPAADRQAEADDFDLSAIGADDAQPPAAGAQSQRPTAPPPGRARRGAAQERGLDVAPRLTQLHKSVHELVAARRNDEAAELCREILETDPSDPEAFSLLESHYRKNRDHARLRQLLLASTRVGGLSVDARKLRLREVAGICEAKLKDAEGAIEAWQSVVALDPADSEAVKSLKRLLQKAQRWDDLAAVLEREAMAATRSDEKIDLISQIAAIHRDKRKDLVEAAEALRQLLALKPDKATRDELCEMLLSVENYVDAVPLLRERIGDEPDERERVRLLRTLSTTLDEKLDDGDGAFEAYQELLGLRPKDNDALGRMQRIDEKSGNVERLINTLERRAMVATRAERPALFMQMGEIAERKLDDADKAAEYYGNVLDLEPENEGALGALYEMFERRGRHADLVELLRERILVEKEPGRRVELYRRMARMLKDHLGMAVEAADAYRGLLSAKEDEEALRFLVDHTREEDVGPAQRAELLQRLAVLITDNAERRELLVELADLLSSQLERPREALEALRKIVDEIDPEHEPALERFAELCEQVDDVAGLAQALTRKLGRVTDLDERIAIEQRLADLYEGKLPDQERAIEALLGWAQDDPSNLHPQRRLKALLVGKGRDADLLATLDALAELEEEFEARDAAVLEAARLAGEALQDFDGAWQRLAPLVEECHDDALALLSELARKAGRAQQLAALCVKAAQEASDVEVQGRHWGAAARIFADELADPTQALEAALRMLASDLSNREYLAQVEEYAARVGAWPRLNQVYDKLLKLAPDDAGRVELLVRHARLLDERADDASEALDRVLRACGLAPSDDALLAQAETLARRAGRSEELLVVYDRKRSKTAEDTGKVELLLRAARLSDSALQDRDRANVYLKSALAIAKASPTLAAEVVRAAEELDRKRPDQGAEQALRTLLRAHREIAEKSDPEVGTALILQAQTLLRERLNDERAAFDLLRQGVSLFPLRDDLYAVLLERAIEWKRLDAVDAHLSRAIDDALDPKTAAALLERRASLLEGPLGRPEDAADVFARLTQLRPDDGVAAERLRQSLRQARRYQDLLLAVHKQMQRARSAEEKLLLLKDAASTWENDLKNRWEALDAWRKVSEFAPEDREAKGAIMRLDRRSVAPPPMRSGAALFADDAPEAGVSLKDSSRVSSELAALASRADEPATSPDAHEEEATPAWGTAKGALASAAEPEPEAAPAAVDKEPATIPPSATPAPRVAQARLSARAAIESEPPAPAQPEAETAPEPTADHDLAMLDAALAAAPAADTTPPPTAASARDTLQVDVVVDDPEPESPPLRMTRPPTLPPRRDRSMVPPPGLQPRASSFPPPLPPGAARSVSTRPSAPPPVPSAARNSLLPPLPGRVSAAPPPLPPSARTGANPSIPPPLPSQRTLAGVPAIPAGGPRSPSLPPPLPRGNKT